MTKKLLLAATMVSFPALPQGGVVLPGPGIPGPVGAAPEAAIPPRVAEHYMSTVQVAVQEPTSELLKRSQRLVREQFSSVFNEWPEFQNQNFEVRTQGNEVMVSIVTDQDIRPTMQQAVTNIIEHLNGRVQARGRSNFYRTAFAPDAGGYLEVKAEEDRATKVKRIRSISAQSVPLRDLLKEIRFQLGGLSYLIPGECAEKLVDWSFGDDDPGAAKPVVDPAKVKDVDTLMKILARSFGMSSENVNGTFVFTGNCPETPPRQRAKGTIPPAELFRNGTAMPSGYRAVAAPQVFFPMVPLE